MLDINDIDDAIVFSLKDDPLSSSELFELANEKKKMTRQTFTEHRDMLIKQNIMKKIHGKKRTDIRYAKFFAADSYVITSKDYSGLKESIEKISESIKKKCDEYKQTFKKITERRNEFYKKLGYDYTGDIDSKISSKYKVHHNDFLQLYRINQEIQQYLHKLLKAYAHLAIVPLSGSFLRAFKSKWKDAQKLVERTISDSMQLVKENNSGDHDIMIRRLLYDTLPSKSENTDQMSGIISLGFLAVNLSE